MKKNIFIACAALLSFVACSKNKETACITENLQYPHSLCAMEDTLLISNLGGDSLDALNAEHADGYILQLIDDSLCEFKVDSGVLFSPKGMARSGNYLYIADVSRVHVVSLNDHKVTTIPLASSDAYANNLEVVGDVLLLTSTAADRIMALKLSSDGAPEKLGFEFYMNVPSPRDLIYHNGKLYISSGRLDGTAGDDNLIYYVDNFIDPKLNKLNSRKGIYDGLTISDGKLFFTDLNEGFVGKINLNRAEKISFLELDMLNKLRKTSKITFFNNILYATDPINNGVLMMKY